MPGSKGTRNILNGCRLQELPCRVERLSILKILPFSITEYSSEYSVTGAIIAMACPIRKGRGGTELALSCFADAMIRDLQTFILDKKG